MGQFRLQRGTRRGVWRIALMALCASLTPAFSLELVTREISDPAFMNREPALGEGGLVSWIAYGTNDDNDTVADVMVLDGNERKSLASTNSNAGMFGSHRPVVQSNTVVWMANFSSAAGQDTTWVLREVVDRDVGAPELPAAFIAGEEPSGRQILTPMTNMDAVTNGILPARRHPSGLGEIVRWDRGGDLKRITVDHRNDFGPSVWGSLMSWQVAKGFPFGWEIMAWDAGTFVQLTTNFYYDMAPKVSGRQIAWYGWDGHDFEIFLHDRDRNVTTQITSNQYDDVSPVIWDGQVAWEGYPAAESDIFLWKNGEIKKLSDNIEDDFNPRIWNGQVVWQGFDGDDFEIYYYDGQNPPFKVTVNTFDDTNPDIGSRFIVWTGFKDNWDAEIYALDKSSEAKSGAEIQVTDNEEEDRDPHTAGNRIVWQGERDRRIGIFLAEPK